MALTLLRALVTVTVRVLLDSWMGDFWNIFLLGRHLGEQTATQPPPSRLLVVRAFVLVDLTWYDSVLVTLLMKPHAIIR